jgi:O-antigen/teichoic acid export membrane protein
MLSNNQEEQKSPKRRFLLILGVTAFIGFCILGFGLIFWNNFPLDIPQTQRTIYGCVILVYAVLRFSRYLRKDPDGN